MFYVDSNQVVIWDFYFENHRRVAFTPQVILVQYEQSKAEAGVTLNLTQKQNLIRNKNQLCTSEASLVNIAHS